MQNKRGISQAFSNAPTGLQLRKAVVADVFDVSKVLVRSITELCASDHSDDPDLVALWTANKDSESILNCIRSGEDIWLADLNGQIAGVASLRNGAEVSRLYVCPDHVSRGVGTALLNRLEQRLLSKGCDQAHLKATTTARTFYMRRGWQLEDTSTDWYGIQQFHMTKRLRAEG